jgi:hypothetical protein
VFSYGVIIYELFHKYIMYFAIALDGTEAEIERYATRVSQGYRCASSSAGRDVCVSMCVQHLHDCVYVVQARYP